MCLNTSMYVGTCLSIVTAAIFMPTYEAIFCRPYDYNIPVIDVILI